MAGASGNGAETLFHAHREWAEILGRQVWSGLGPQNGLTIDDYLALARAGLWQACRRYRSSRGRPFKAFARQRVRGAVLDGVREADEVGRSRRRDGLRGATLSMEGPSYAPQGRPDEGSFRQVLPSLRAPAPEARAEAFDGLAALLAGLDLRARSVAWLVGIEGLYQWQAAMVLGISQPAVSAAWAEVRGRLKCTLAEAGS